MQPDVRQHKSTLAVEAPRRVYVPIAPRHDGEGVGIAPGQLSQNRANQALGAGFFIAET